MVICFINIILKNKFYLIFFIILLVLFNYDSICSIFKIKKFLKSQSKEQIYNLEKELSNSYFVFYSWYLTDEYIFSYDKLKKIYYKDIIVIEDFISLATTVHPYKELGSKLIIYLKNKEKYKIIVPNTISEKFISYIKEKIQIFILEL